MSDGKAYDWQCPHAVPDCRTCRSSSAAERFRRYEDALGEIAACADWCEDCEPTEAKLATYTTQPYGVPLFLCDEHAEHARAAYKKAASKNYGSQPTIEPHEQEVETTIALRALGLLPMPPISEDQPR